MVTNFSRVIVLDTRWYATTALINLPESSRISKSTLRKPFLYPEHQKTIPRTVRMRRLAFMNRRFMWTSSSTQKIAAASVTM
jgi:hypothetical protein